MIKVCNLSNSKLGFCVNSKEFSNPVKIVIAYEGAEFSNGEICTKDIANALVKTTDLDNYRPPLLVNHDWDAENIRGYMKNIYIDDEGKVVTEFEIVDNEAKDNIELGKWQNVSVTFDSENYQIQEVSIVSVPYVKGAKIIENSEQNNEWSLSKMEEEKKEVENANFFDDDSKMEKLQILLDKLGAEDEGGECSQFLKELVNKAKMDSAAEPKPEEKEVSNEEDKDKEAEAESEDVEVVEEKVDDKEEEKNSCSEKKQVSNSSLLIQNQKLLVKNKELIAKCNMLQNKINEMGNKDTVDKFVSNLMKNGVITVALEGVEKDFCMRLINNSKELFDNYAEIQNARVAMFQTITGKRMSIPNAGNSNSKVENELFAQFEKLNKKS